MKNKIIKLTLLLIFIAILICLGIKYYQYSTIIKISKKNMDLINSKNFSYEIKPQDISKNSITRTVVKNNKLKYQTIDKDGLINTFYVDLENNVTTIVSEKDKTYSILQNETLFRPSFTNPPFIFSLVADNILESNFLEKIEFAFSIRSISTEKLNGTDCYKISYKDSLDEETSYFDKNTLFPVRAENSHVLVADYIVKSNINEEDENLTFTNASNEYTLIENNNL